MAARCSAGQLPGGKKRGGVARSPGEPRKDAWGHPSFRPGTVPPIGGTAYGADFGRHGVRCLLWQARLGGGVAASLRSLAGTPRRPFNARPSGRAGLRPAVAGRRAVRRNSARYHAGRGGRWTAGRTRPPPGFRRRYATAADRRHTCTPGRRPRRKRCPLEWCRRWTARFRAADGWQEWCCLSAAPAGRQGGGGRALSGPCKGRLGASWFRDAKASCFRPGYCPAGTFPGKGSGQGDGVLWGHWTLPNFRALVR